MSKGYLGFLHPEKGVITKQYVTPCPPHNHNIWELVFFLDGIAKTSVNKKEYDATSGDIFLVGPPHLHEISIVKTPHLHQDIYFQEEDFLSVLSNLPKNFQDEILGGTRLVHLKLSGESYLAAKSLCEHLLNFSVFDTSLGRTSTQEFEKCLSLSILNYVIGLYVIAYSSRHSQTPKWLLDFVNELQKPEVFSKRVSDIIALTNYSHSQVGTIFKNYKGVSLVDYLIGIRMNYARELLEATSKSVLTISEDCGYSSLSSFIKLFCEKTGYSPLQYRKKRQQELQSLVVPVYQKID